MTKDERTKKAIEMKKKYNEEFEALHFKDLGIECCGSCAWSECSKDGAYSCHNKSIPNALLKQMKINMLCICDKYESYFKRS